MWSLLLGYCFFTFILPGIVMKLLASRLGMDDAPGGSATFIAAAVMLIGSIGFSVYALAATPVHVVDIVDGDTVRVRVDGNVPGWDVFDVRLIGVNTPEKRSRCDTDEQKATEREMAARAEDYVRERIEGAQRVEIDRQGEDGFNRPLGVVLLDGKSLNDDLLREGWTLPYKPGTHGLQFCGDAQKGAYPVE